MLLGSPPLCQWEDESKRNPFVEGRPSDEPSNSISPPDWQHGWYVDAALPCLFGERTEWHSFRRNGQNLMISRLSLGDTDIPNFTINSIRLTTFLSRARFGESFIVSRWTETILTIEKIKFAVLQIKSVAIASMFICTTGASKWSAVAHGEWIDCTWVLVANHCDLSVALSSSKTMSRDCSENESSGGEEHKLGED